MLTEDSEKIKNFKGFRLAGTSMKNMMDTKNHPCYVTKYIILSEIKTPKAYLKHHPNHQRNTWFIFQYILEKPLPHYLPSDWDLSKEWEELKSLGYTEKTACASCRAGVIVTITRRAD